jgi:hypothetical protein
MLEKPNLVPTSRGVLLGVRVRGRVIRFLLSMGACVLQRPIATPRLQRQIGKEPLNNNRCSHYLVKLSLYRRWDVLSRLDF